MLDKQRDLRSAPARSECRARAPPSSRPETEPLRRDRRDRLPVALKPRHSHLFARHFGVGTKVFVAHDVGELEAHPGARGRLGIEMLVTEIDPGP